jgi:hypothetical protein
MKINTQFLLFLGSAVACGILAQYFGPKSYIVGGVGAVTLLQGLVLWFRVLFTWF